MEKEIENYIISTLKQTYNLSIDNSEQDYFSAGLDSFSFINFINEIEEKYHIKFNNDDFQNRNFSVIKGLVEVIKERINV